MEILCRSDDNGAAAVRSMVEILVAETFLVAEKCLLCLLLAVGSLSGGTVGEESEVILRIMGKRKPERVPENMDDGDSDDEDADDSDDDDDQDDDGEEDVSGDEDNDDGEDDDDGPEANGEGGSDGEDDDDEDEDEDDGEEDDDDEEEDEEGLAQPPSKKRK